ncbi:hypothetical protein [Segatella copri]|nr:hypothetical protein [Segatella copri]MCW4120225.1 hypothetical protein [Segatella copri]
MGDGMEGVIGMVWKEQYGRNWKELEGMDEMEGMEGMDGIPCKDTAFL